MTAILQTYLPSFDEITADQINETRAILEALWGLYAPGVDVRRNSVLGDSFIAGAAGIFTALGIAGDRLRSDMDPENVGNGIIYDCDFVERFLAYFSVYATPDHGTTGFVRLVFDRQPAGGLLALPRHLRFREAGGADDIDVRLPFPGEIQIIAAGNPIPPGTNSFRLSQTGASTFETVLPVQASAVLDVSDSATMETTEEVTGLTSASAVGFQTIPLDVGLPALARKTRAAVYAATPTTLAGLRRFAEVHLPGVDAISAAGPGDIEQLRASVNGLGFPKAAADIYVRGKRAFREVTQLVQLFYDGANDRFVGRFEPTSTPLLLRGIVWEGNTDVALTPTVWLRSAAGLPGVLSAGSGVESYFISLPMPTGSDAPVSVTPGSPDPYAWFLVTYLADDEVAATRQILAGPDWAPFNLDVAVRPFVVMDIESIRISYRRRAGSRVTLAAARDEIYKNVLETAPPVPLSYASWVDSMRYAGAEVVTAVAVGGAVRWTIADLVIPPEADPTSDFDAANAAALPAPSVGISSSADLHVAMVDPLLGTEDATNHAVGPRSLTWWTEPERITFEEVQ